MTYDATISELLRKLDDFKFEQRIVNEEARQFRERTDIRLARLEAGVLGDDDIGSRGIVERVRDLEVITLSSTITGRTLLRVLAAIGFITSSAYGLVVGATSFFDWLNRAANPPHH